MPQLTRVPLISYTPSSKYLKENQLNQHIPMEKFPDIRDSFEGLSKSSSSPVKQPNVYVNGNGSNRVGATWTGKHIRQKSLSDAFNTIRTRSESIAPTVHDVADALKAPVSAKLVSLCIIWYLSSALTNTSSKAILNAFPKPATLTMVQFGFVACFCISFSWLSSMFSIVREAIPALRNGLRYPSRDVLMTTLPLASFQIGGHLLSASATAKIPVSLVHTIKGLSPLFTVLAYRFIFDIRYPMATYLSLIPLTLGVMLACSASFAGNLFGIFYAFLAALIFVTQNIFSKRLFNEAAVAEYSGSSFQKIDKLNLLCYSSGLAFLLTSPIWFCSEGLDLLRDFFHDGSIDLAAGTPSKPAFDHGRLAVEFIFNGTFHFAQNIIAFILLSIVSPVTYSVASLIKRVFIVVIAIIWFQSPTTKIQALGIALTFLGLYLYDKTKSDKVDRKAKLMNIKEKSILPQPNMIKNNLVEPLVSSRSNGYVLGIDKREDSLGNTRGGRQRGTSNAAWLPSSTRQEKAWRSQDLSSAPASGSSLSHGDYVGVSRSE
ncbi:putative transporter C83.11 [Golovinomyces cichoracearum]|uniref:Putative transporter C83.11 n=1 Tax=Golovinomyces cichoracearum TaxID=62708 RepID=A0A420JAQ5_9PEZI|nr:putative transporter C83.11 [Golovinomyces cichoracearum]